MKIIFPLIFLFVAFLSFMACTESHSAGSGQAIRISGPDGVECYGILNGSGEVVGGNCK